MKNHNLPPYRSADYEQYWHTEIFSVIQTFQAERLELPRLWSVKADLSERRFVALSADRTTRSLGACGVRGRKGRMSDNFEEGMSNVARFWWYSEYEMDRSELCNQNTNFIKGVFVLNFENVEKTIREQIENIPRLTRQMLATPPWPVIMPHAWVSHS